MNAVQRGRVLGASMLLIFSVGMFSNFSLQPALFADGGLLVNAAERPGSIGLVCLLALVTGLVSTWIASMLTAWRRDDAPVLARFYFAVVVAGLALSLVEASTIYAFQRLSTLYHDSAGEPGTAFRAAAAGLAGLRNGIHYLDKLLGGVGVFLLFALLLTLRLLPRPIALFGLVASGIQMLGVVQGVLGCDVNHLLLAPLALAFVVTSFWLLVRGFSAETVQGTSGEERGTRSRLAG